MARHFDQEIQELFGKLMLMGNLAESMIKLAVTALVERDESRIGEVFAKEHEVNELQIEVDDQAIKLTATQQPVAEDVRFLFVASRVATDLERIADQAVNICQNAHQVLTYPMVKPLVDFPILAEVAQKMIRESLESLARRDSDLARRVFEDEKRVDAFRDQIFRELLTYMMSDPRTIPAVLALILISRSLERVGDHATNVAEEVIYLVQGRDLRHHHETKKRGLGS
jgi:phosphate transport system protein